MYILHPSLRSTRSRAWVAGPLMAAALIIGACGAGSLSQAAVPTLPTTGTRLAESFDPIAIAHSLESGADCTGTRAEHAIEESYAHLTWRLVCPRPPGDRTVYFQLVDAVEAFIATAGATIGSGSGIAEDDLLLDGTSFTFDGVRGHVRVMSNDLDEERLLIVVTLDEVAS